MILDTCALLWLAQGGAKLSRAALRAFEAAPAVHVCAISGFEIGLKARRGRLVLPASPQAWFEAVLEHHGVSVIPLDLAACLRATDLPAVHADPCDRLIIACAQLHGLPVVTADPTFREYDVEVIW